MITDAEIIELETLLREQEVFLLYKSLEQYNEKTSPNYKLLKESVTNQKYVDEKIVSGYRGVILEGSSRCFSENQKVITETGSVEISKIEIGQKVLSHNFETGENEYLKVTNLFKSQNQKKSFRIKLKNGEVIEATEDHKFYVNGKWTELKNIIDEFKRNTEKK